MLYRRWQLSNGYGTRFVHRSMLVFTLISDSRQLIVDGSKNISEKGRPQIRSSTTPILAIGRSFPVTD